MGLFFRPFALGPREQSARVYRVWCVSSSRLVTRARIQVFHTQIKPSERLLGLASFQTHSRMMRTSLSRLAAPIAPHSPPPTKEQVT